MSDEDQKLRVRLVGRNGRRRYEAASKERLVAACLEPGVSVSRLAPASEVDQEGPRGQIAAAVVTFGVHPGSA